MVTKTIVGVAGQAADRDAVALARALAPGGELVLACAYPYDEAPSRFLMLGYGNALRDATRQEITRLRDDAGIPHARIELVADLSPARALHRIAEREHAGLIVVGSSHRGGLGRTLLGDVARAALHGSPCPVAVAPQGHEPGPLRRIGVAFDGSPESEAALAFAAALAAEHGARLSLRTAVAATIGMAGAGGYAVTVDEIVESLRADAQERLDEAVAALDVEADGVARRGSPAEVLDALCAESDLVVAGSRTWGAARRLALGSTADRLIHHAPCPVVVVPRGAAVAATAVAETAGTAGAHGGAER